MNDQDQQPLRNQIFDGQLEQRFLNWYHRFFSIAEIEGNRILQWAFGAVLLTFFLTFNSWALNQLTTRTAYEEGNHMCWPYFQACGEWLFLRVLPDGYSQTTLYMVLFGLMVLIVYLISRREWVLSHMLMVVLFVWHSLALFVLAWFGGNYDYYQWIFAATILFLPHKEFFLKLYLVLFYFLAVTIKIHEGWIVGTYFSSMQTGIPLFPEWSTPVMTNFVIGMQMVGAWFLFSRDWVKQRLVLAYFVLFHLYSGILVTYRYPATVLPMLLILFGPWYRNTPVPLDRRSIAGWVLVVVLVCLQLVSVMIPGDEKLTLEGNNYGLYMFEANHQCISNSQVYVGDQVVDSIEQSTANARHRCDPYRYWFHMKNICARAPEVTSIAWTLDHSVNGGPFLRIVDVPDACALEYQAFSHNDWIKTEADQPAIIGYPVKNHYR